MYKRFEALCKERGVTPYRVAKETGLTTSTLSNWKAGRYCPKFNKLSKIAEFFGVQTSYLSGNSDDRYGGPVKKAVSIDLAPYEKAIKRAIKKGDIKIENSPENIEGAEDEAMTPEEVTRAIDFFQRFEKASPEIQAAIETLLKVPQSDS